MPQRKKSCILKSVMVHLRDFQSRSTDGRHHQETSMSIGRLICIHDLAKMDIVEISMETRPTISASLFASVLVHRVCQLAPNCCLLRRRPSRLLIALTSTTARKLRWTQLRQIVQQNMVLQKCLA